MLNPRSIIVRSFFDRRPTSLARTTALGLLVRILAEADDGPPDAVERLRIEREQIRATDSRLPGIGLARLIASSISFISLMNFSSSLVSGIPLARWSNIRSRRANSWCSLMNCLVASHRRNTFGIADLDRIVSTRASC